MLRADSAVADRICVAQIGAAHGIRGEVRLNSFTADPMAVADYGPLETEDGTRELRDRDGAAGQGPSGRAAARRRTTATPPSGSPTSSSSCRATRLPPPAADEFYHADLIGLAAVDRRRRRVRHRGGGPQFRRRRPPGIAAAGGWRDRDAAVHRGDRAERSTSRAGASWSIRRRRRASRADAREAADRAMAIRFFSQSETHREFSNFAPFGIDLDGRALADDRALLPGAEVHRPGAADEDSHGREADHREEARRQASRPDPARLGRGEGRGDVSGGAAQVRAASRAARVAAGDRRRGRSSRACPTDYYWGVGRDGTGQNKLGKIIERIRAELRAALAGRT